MAVMFPEFHRDSIREIAVSHGNKSLVISGGFDGNVNEFSMKTHCIGFCD